jgi:hypothetical protein
MSCRYARSTVALAAFLLITPATSALAGWQFDVETGAVLSGYNDVRIPGAGGTKFSLTDDLSTEEASYLRGMLTYTFRQRHAFSVLVAPLRLKAEGSLEDSLRFAGETFAPGADLDGTYRFDSYRLTYRYDIHRGRNTKVGVGLTGKIRDAETAIESADQSAKKTNTGFVPLLHGAFEWWFAERTSLLIVADALAAPQGRAEDVLVAVRFEPVPPLAIRIGYRMLEGGADNDEVYTFALLHYFGLGFTLSF